MNCRNGRLVWEAHLAPGSTFGGALGSAAVVGDRIVASSNIGDPVSNATTNTSVVTALNPATGHSEWNRQFAGNVFGPVSAVTGVAFVGTDQGMMTALDVSDGRTLWSYRVPGQGRRRAFRRRWPGALGLRIHLVQRVRPGRRD